MAYIVEFEISGLAGRKKDYSIKLDRNTNIFFGDNGSGKTSLLRILHSAMRGQSKALEHVPFKSASVSIYSETYQKVIVRTISKKSKRDSKNITLPGFDRDIIRSFPEKLRDSHTPEWKTKETEDMEIAGSHWAHIYLPTWRLYTSSESQHLCRPSAKMGQIRGH